MFHWQFECQVWLYFNLFFMIFLICRQPWVFCFCFEFFSIFLQQDLRTCFTRWRWSLRTGIACTVTRLSLRLHHLTFDQRPAPKFITTLVSTRCHELFVKFLSHLSTMRCLNCCDRRALWWRCVGLSWGLGFIWRCVQVGHLEKLLILLFALGPLGLFAFPIIFLVIWKSDKFAIYKHNSFYLFPDIFRAKVKLCSKIW